MTITDQLDSIKATQRWILTLHGLLVSHGHVPCVRCLLLRGCTPFSSHKYGQVSTLKPRLIGIVHNSIRVGVIVVENYLDSHCEFATAKPKRTAEKMPIEQCLQTDHHSRDAGCIGCIWLYLVSYSYYYSYSYSC
jgi:hypothetical protein